MRYHYLRLSLAERDRKPPLSEAYRWDPARIPRTEYLLETFNRRIDFEARKKSLVYIPIGEERTGHRTFLLGRVGRRVEVMETRSPKFDFMEVGREGWGAANVVIDISDHEDGQKVAFQRHWSVGRPHFIMSQLARHINRTNGRFGWVMQVHCIPMEESFWDFVGTNRDRVTAAEFDFVVPNLIFESESDIGQSLDEARLLVNATEVRHTLINPEGRLRLDRDHLGDAVRYTEKGGGKAKLKSGGRVIYNSESKVSSVSVRDDEPLTKENLSFRERLIRRLFRW